MRGREGKGGGTTLSTPCRKFLAMPLIIRWFCRADDVIECWLAVTDNNSWWTRLMFLQPWHGDDISASQLLHAAADAANEKSIIGFPLPRATLISSCMTSLATDPMGLVRQAASAFHSLSTPPRSASYASFYAPLLLLQEDFAYTAASPLRGSSSNFSALWAGEA